MRDGRLLKKCLTVVAGLQEEMFCCHTELTDDLAMFSLVSIADRRMRRPAG